MGGCVSSHGRCFSSRLTTIGFICACSFLSILAGYILEYSSVYAMNDQFNFGIANPMNAALPLSHLAGSL